ncbi:carbohydrate ABC transporter membrane protein 2, CUT1 family [Halanaerobium praevalens DSM 2228]|uniref:Carbohydrate ABC transporter membrane protein 2, CUT1 family n=2 Tax=Halanaerobium praevalens TaxID=2331 RepID=E3DNI9_HALPG|nr:carbohydrate ABC transporter permease [Halanaerobium praevalens]ADO76527.1 carbohydrate ABC transporter membrane protein 2, CUT1 family [Halanaerobium praevalens DSM 2228]
MLGISNKNKYKKITIHTIVIIGSLFMIGPFIWMLLTSLKTLGETTQVPPVIFPKEIIWSNYSDVLKLLPFAKFFFNTFITALGRTVGQLLISSMAAYAFARIEFPGRKMLFLMILSILMVPPQSFYIPQYIIMGKLGWLNSLKALIFPGLFSAFGTFLLRQFFMTLPKELEESARLDGCNHFQIYWHIMLPLAKPGLIALAIFVVRWSWNDFMWPLIVNTSTSKMTLSVGLASLQGQYLTNYPVLMAGALIAIFPMLIIFILLQKQFVEGIALTGTKG